MTIFNRKPQPAADPNLLFVGDLVWFVSAASNEDWYYDEYAEAGVLLATDTTTNRGLVVWFDHDARILREWWVEGVRLERRFENEGVFTFDRKWQQKAA